MNFSSLTGRPSCALYKALPGGWELYDALPPLKDAQPGRCCHTSHAYKRLAMGCKAAGTLPCSKVCPRSTRL